jgi:SnoaL-like domain
VSPTASFAEVSEGVRAAMAGYTHALDDGRTDDVVDAFCADGWCDMPGLGRHEGHDALRQAYGRIQSAGGQRHLVVNTEVTHWDSDQAEATSDVVVLVKGEGGWSVGIVGRYQDVLHRDGDRWRFHSRIAKFAR